MFLCPTEGTVYSCPFLFPARDFNTPHPAGGMAVPGFLSSGNKDKTVFLLGKAMFVPKQRKAK
jgi:hypothetical protein